MERLICRLCYGPVSEVLVLRPMPLPDDYRQDAESYPTRLMQCENCGHVQIGDIVDPQVMFGRGYHYRTGYSPSLVEHFQRYAVDLSIVANLDSDSTVIDIGSNDGTLLKAFHKYSGCQILGVDPAATDDYPAWRDFLHRSLAHMLRANHTPEGAGADLVTANNVLAHTDRVSSLLDSIYILMAEEGFACFEVAYLPDMLENGTFETIYHEHVSYFAFQPLQQCLLRHGLMPISVQHVHTHGGSIRVICKRGAQALACDEFPVSQDSFNQLSDRITSRRNRLHRLWHGGSAFGASAKASVLIHQLDLRPSVVVDDTPGKQGKWMPGTTIPIVDRGYLKDDDNLLVLAWNEASAITRSLAQFQHRFIIAAPEPYVI